MAPQPNDVPRADEALRKMAAALAEGRLEEAVALGREAHEAAPWHAGAISGLVRALRRAGHGEEARSLLDAVPADLAGPSNDLVAVAELCLREGLGSPARGILRSVLESDPSRAPAAELLARAYFADSDLAAVVAVCEGFRLRGKATPTLLRMLAAAYEQLGDLAPAGEVARLYAQAAPLDPHAHYHLATLEHRDGDLREAMARYHLAVELSGSDGELAGAATDGMRALDALQLRQITALAASDLAFRLSLGRDAREAVMSRGFALSDEGLAILVSLDLEALVREWAGKQGLGHH